MELEKIQKIEQSLEKIKETLEADKKLQEDYNKVINETIDAIENHVIKHLAHKKHFYWYGVICIQSKMTHLNLLSLLMGNSAVKK